MPRYIRYDKKNPHIKPNKYLISLSLHETDLPLMRLKNNCLQQRV